jgi:hypothetical protein
MYDPILANATIAGMTPHYDEFVSCGHRVPQSVANAGAYTGLNGFIAAREKLADDWLSGDHHVLLAGADWHSTDQLEQCDETVVQSDGFVYYVGLCPEGTYPC